MRESTILQLVRRLWRRWTMFEKSARRSIERLKVNDNTRSQMSISYAKPRDSNRWSTMIGKRRRTQVVVEARRTIDARRKEKEKWRRKKRERVFIFRESDGWGDAKRLARNGRANPNGATLGLVAGTGAPFTRSNFIIWNSRCLKCLKSWLSWLS